MTIEETVKALKSAFTSKSSEVEKLANELKESLAKNEALGAEVELLKEKAEAYDSLMREKSEASAKAEELAKALAESEKLKADAVSQIETVGKKAAAIASSVGVEPVEISAADGQTNKSPEEAWNEYVSMKDPAKKLAFYKTNQKAIFAHLGVKA